jgi:endogenous inhibitor of DNA gyrase (YacG/DUF329 family)
MGSKLKVKCPICKKKTNWENNPYRPFCSKECKLADLYHWIEEDYRIKVSEIDLLNNTGIHLNKKEE